MSLLRGVMRLRPQVRSRVPPWDLAVVRHQITDQPRHEHGTDSPAPGHDREDLNELEHPHPPGPYTKLSLLRDPSTPPHWRPLLPDIDEILQRLTEVSIRQQQITEHLAARQGQTEQELDALRTATARRVLLPDPWYNRGHLRTTWRRNNWVFGILEMKGHRRLPILKIVKNRSRQTLIPIIRRHVRRGSTVFSDCWRAYVQALPRHGYRHFTVNHSEIFVDPVTGCHTQHIEHAWQSIKSQVNKHRGNKSTPLLKEHLKCIQLYHWLGKLNRQGVIAQLFHDIRKDFEIH
ncbi:uncharacterized protein LOC107715434 [Sinocyclocheilus rhinocerous]|uniref:uncharacterized protein LOC107715434 n=1 Tax=Sinocyclocheilus rhinocerous TaxID=307959 RepID=UPI0007B9D808|nr:PREDICTED: uncharacterized protein LOC107715434 [Sinocyclocheilus rhinocerous]